MTWIVRILALVGVVAIGLGVWMGPQLWSYKTAFDSFDDKAFETYKGMADRLVETGNAAEATVWKRPRWPRG